MSGRRSSFAGSVFINCPFDREYWPTFEAVVFTVLACGFTPRCALEEIDSGAVRLTKIQRLIGGSRFGIHELSRVELTAVNNLPRFNMPFELGLDIGAKTFGRKQVQTIRFVDFVPRTPRPRVSGTPELPNSRATELPALQAIKSSDSVWDVENPRLAPTYP
jgi:hypothetical protein